MEKEIINDISSKFIGILHDIYIKGNITKETYIEHTATKLEYLKKYGDQAIYNKQKALVDKDLSL